MSDTPRTDCLYDDIGYSRLFDFARQLERELNEQLLLNAKGEEREYVLLGKVDRLERELSAAKYEIECQALALGHLRQRRDELEREISALKRSFAEDWSGDGLSLAENNAKLRAELAALKKGEFICKQCGLRKDDEHEPGDF